MLRIFASAALAIGSPLILLAVCYFVTYIPLVKWMLDIDDDDSPIMRIAAGFAAIAACVIFPLAILLILLLLFVMFYNLL